MASSEPAPKLTCSLHPTIPLVLHNAPPYLTRDFVCDLCFKIGEGPTYHCKTCKYDLHPSCCTLQPALRSCAHEHPLTLQPAHRHAQSRKKCDGCQQHLAGSEWSYRCDPCNFDVHARCAKLRERIITSFHPYPLKLLKKSPYPPRHLQCDLCGEKMPTHGWVYHCTNCKFDLHPECALLPRDPLCSAHPHRLSTCGYRTYHGKSYVCDVCHEFGGELGFRCDKCNFNIHPKCLKSCFLSVLANRPDIIREDYMNELCVLQDDVPAFPNEIAFKIIEEEMGVPLEQVFSKLSASPIAAASLGQVYRGTLRSTGEEVAIKVLRPNIEPIIIRDLFLFRNLASLLNPFSVQKLGCNAELIVDEFGEKLLEELDYTLEARNIEDFYENFKVDKTVKIPLVYKQLSGQQVLVMEWIDGIRCTDPQGIKNAGIDVEAFITVGVSAALRQLLEFGLFHGDPHPGNIFAMRDGRIAYVDFGNVAELSQRNKQILIDAVVHAVNEDYMEMAGDFTRLGFLAPGTDVKPIVPALEAIWQNSTGKGLADFNFRSVTGKFNQLVYQYPIRIPERFSLVIRSLLTQEGICLTLSPDFKFLEVAYPYVAKRLLTDPDPALRERLLQVLFKDGLFQWKRLENLIVLAREQVTMMNRNLPVNGSQPASTNGSSVGRSKQPAGGKLDLTDTIKDGARVVATDAELRRQLMMAFTEDSRLHVRELYDIYRLIEGEFNPSTVLTDLVQGLPNATRELMLSWSDSVLSDRRR